MATAPALQISGPPQAITPLTDEAWRRWFTEVVWPIIGAGWQNSGPQGTFTQLQVGKARWTTANAFQELITTDQGIYVNYSSTVEEIIYGFACNVHRGAGASFVVGAQINAWGEVGSSGDVFGVVGQSTSQPFSGIRNVIGSEMSVVSQAGTNTDAKWGVNVVFKDRGDGVAAVVMGLSSDYFNYFSEGVVFASQVRSSTGEHCGWNCGIDFLDASLDSSAVPAWSSTSTYSAGMIVSHGGNLYKAIQTSTNQTPADPSSYWVQHAVGTSNLAVGIDFSSVSTTTMARVKSAMRLRGTMAVHWEQSAQIGTWMDNATNYFRVCDNSGTLTLAVDVVTGIIATRQAAIAPGAGAIATLAKVGGSGPTTATQAGWVAEVFNGVTYYHPVWT